MKQKNLISRNEKVLTIAAGFLLISIILMMVIIPGILNDTSTKASPGNAVLGISLAILIRLAIFMGYLKFIRNNRRNSTNRKAEYLVIGFLLMFLGLIYTDGAFAFLTHEDIPHVSPFMFASVLCDTVASIMTTRLYFINSHTEKKAGLIKIPAWAMSLIVFVVSIVSAFIFENTSIPGNSALGIIGFIFYIILIPAACFIICRIHPKSKWYTPFICNPVGVLGTIFHPLAWTTLSEYLLFAGSLALSVLAAYVGAKTGQRRMSQVQN